MQTAAQIAVSRLAAKGYQAETRGPSLVAVQDPVHSGGRIVSHDEVLLKADGLAVWKFIDVRS